MSTGNRIRWLLVTWFGCGLSPFAPGTAGTMGAVVFAVLLQLAAPERQVAALLGAAAVLFVVGCRMTKFTVDVLQKEDPGPFVLDEVVGYLLTVGGYSALSGVEAGAMAHTAAFFVFRAMDVFKPPPARQFEDLPGAIGIMADDAMAGVYAALILWAGLPLLGV